MPDGNLVSPPRLEIAVHEVDGRVELLGNFEAHAANSPHPQISQIIPAGLGLAEICVISG
jgi:hypothetical protein